MSPAPRAPTNDPALSTVSAQRMTRGRSVCPCEATAETEPLFFIETVDPRCFTGARRAPLHAPLIVRAIVPGRRCCLVPRPRCLPARRQGSTPAPPQESPHTGVAPALGWRAARHRTPRDPGENAPPPPFGRHDPGERSVPYGTGFSLIDGKHRRRSSACGGGGGGWLPLSRRQNRGIYCVRRSREPGRGPDERRGVGCGGGSLRGAAGATRCPAP
jgi:hypothetical protein